MLIARLEPENSVEEILDGFATSTVNRDFLVIGNTKTPLGKKLVDKYQDSRIKFIGYVSGIEKLDSLRYFSNLYFHGHTVGGTNPSLLEAMACGLVPIVLKISNLYSDIIIDKINGFILKKNSILFVF